MIRLGRQRSRGGRSFGGGRLIIALVIAAIAVVSFLSTRTTNPITGETQYVSLTEEQEIALGLQAAPQMAAQHGGLAANESERALLDAVCARLLENSDAGQSEYPFDCHLLADPETINAFALPGGQVFITKALFDRLETEGQLAGVMAHEIGHVIGRHSAEHIAKAELTQGLTGAAVIAASDPNNPQSGQYAAQMAVLVGQLVNMKYGRDDELESDRLGVEYMVQAGYDPQGMIRVMEILAGSSEGARPPEFFSTHPNPDNRIERIREAIDQLFPNGVPDNLDE